MENRRGKYECHSIDQVSFQYTGGFALKEVDFRVQRGEVFALLGPNGAGKTTTIRLINGLLKASSGSIRVLGWILIRMELPSAAKVEY
jgi:ABC-type multidrug transport system ATPase subunit